MMVVMTVITQFVVVQTRAKISNCILTTKFAKASSLKFLAIVLQIAQDDFEIVFVIRMEHLTLDRFEIFSKMIFIVSYNVTKILLKV